MLRNIVSELGAQEESDREETKLPTPDASQPTSCGQFDGVVGILQSEEEDDSDLSGVSTTSGSGVGGLCPLRHF